MFAKCAAALLALALTAGVGLAQQEYGRASGGQLDLLTKQPSRLSGSLGLTFSRSSLFGGNAKGYEGTLGGAVVPDRLWFFGSMQRNDTPLFSSALPQVALTPASFGKLDAHLGDRQTLSAIAVRSPFSPVPSSFLSTRYTGIISSNAFFTASVSQSVAH